MTENYEFKEYLEKKIREKIKSVGESAQFFKSLLGASREQRVVSVGDLEAGLSCYRGLVEIVTLMGVYQESFRGDTDDRIIGLKSGLEKTLKTSQIAIQKMLNALVNRE